MRENGGPGRVVPSRPAASDPGRSSERMRHMDKRTQINLLKFRLHKLTVREKDNAGVCRKIRRQIRNLERACAPDGAQAPEGEG